MNTDMKTDELEFIEILKINFSYLG